MPTRKFTFMKQWLKKYRFLPHLISSTVPKLALFIVMESVTVLLKGSTKFKFRISDKHSKTIEMILIYYHILNEIIFWLKRMKVTYNISYLKIPRQSLKNTKAIFIFIDSFSLMPVFISMKVY